MIRSYKLVKNEDGKKEMRIIGILKFYSRGVVEIKR